MASRESISASEFERRKPGHTVAFLGNELLAAVNREIVSPAEISSVAPLVRSPVHRPKILIEARAIPYIGGTVHSDWRRLEFSTEMGIGIQFPESGQQLFWGLVTPHLPIQSWRALQLLHEVQEIRDGTLAGAWAVAQRSIHSIDNDSVARFAKDVGEERFPLVRKEVLKKTPSPEHLIKIVGELSKVGIPVEYWEYQQEMQTGRMQPEPRVIRMYEINRELVALYQQEEASFRSKAPRL